MTIKTDHDRLMRRANAIDVRDDQRRARRMVRTVAKAARLSGNHEFARGLVDITRGLVEVAPIAQPEPEVVELPRVTLNAIRDSYTGDGVESADSVDDLTRGILH